MKKFNKEELIEQNRIFFKDCSIDDLIKWEKVIFQKYQSLNVLEYKKKMGEIFDEAFLFTNNNNLLIMKNIIVKKQYKIGFYPGSFSPFHIGHYNILEKAEKLLDKVIIGIGKNFDKIENEEYNFPEAINNREIVEYGGLLITIIEEIKKHGDVFLVRGLRNEHDLHYEENLRNAIKDFLPDQNFIYLFCDKEYEHISSTLIRDITSRNDENVKYFIEKYCLK